MNKNVAVNIIDYASDSERVSEVADRAEALARELLTLPKDTRRKVVETFIHRNWKPEEIKALLGSVSVQLLRKLICRKLGVSSS